MLTCKKSEQQVSVAVRCCPGVGWCAGYSKPQSFLKQKEVNGFKDSRFPSTWNYHSRNRIQLVQRCSKIQASNPRNIYGYKKQWFFKARILPLHELWTWYCSLCREILCWDEGLVEVTLSRFSSGQGVQGIRWLNTSSRHKGIGQLTHWPGAVRLFFSSKELKEN